MGVWIFGWKPTKVNGHFHHIISKVQTMDSTYYCWCWPWSPAWGDGYQVSPQKNHSFFFSPFPHCSLWKEVTKHSPHQRGVELCSSFLRMNCPHKLLELCTGTLSLSPIYLFNHLFVWAQSHGYLFYTLGYNPILLYFVTQIIPFGPLEALSQFFLCPSDIHPHHYEAFFFLALPFFVALQKALGSTLFFF